MGRAIDFQIKLVDKLSKPSKDMAAGLDKTQRAARDLREKIGDLKAKFDQQSVAMTKTAAALDQHMQAENVDKAAVDKLTESLNKQAKALELTQRGIRGNTEKLKDMKTATPKGDGGGFAKLAGGAMSTLAPLAAAVVSFKALSAVAETAFAARGEKLAIMGQLQSITGSADKAKEVYTHTQKIADELGMSQLKVQELSTDLLKSRLPSTALEGTITALTALEKGQGPEAAAKLQSIVKGSAFKKSFGVISREDALALGTTQAEIYKEIATKTHKGVNQVRDEMRYGQVSAKDGLDALNALLTRKNSAALAIAKMDPSALLGKFKETMSRLFENIDLSAIGKALQSFTMLFDRTTVSGKAIRMMIDGAGKAIGKLVEVGAPLVEKFVKGLIILGLKLYIALIPTIGAVTRGLKALGIDGESTGNALLGVFNFLGDSLERALNLVGVLTQSFEVLAKVVTGGNFKEASAGLGDKMFKAVNPAEFANLGKMAADGFTGGMASKGADMLKGAMQFAGLMPKGIAKELDMHSPSRKLQGMADMAASSWTNRLATKNMNGAFDGLGDIAAPSPGAARGPTAAGQGGASGSGASISLGGLTVQLQGGASGADTAKIVVAELVKQIEALATQLGQPVSFGVTT